VPSSRALRHWCLHLGFRSRTLHAALSWNPSLVDDRLPGRPPLSGTSVGRTSGAKGSAGPHRGCCSPGAPPAEGIGRAPGPSFRMASEAASRGALYGGNVGLARSLVRVRSHLRLLYRRRLPISTRGVMNIGAPGEPLVRMFHVKPGEPSCRPDHAHEQETLRSAQSVGVDDGPTFGLTPAPCSAPRATAIGPADVPRRADPTRVRAACRPCLLPQRRHPGRACRTRTTSVSLLPLVSYATPASFE
jgi:hypothetical protein